MLASGSLETCIKVTFDEASESLQNPMAFTGCSVARASGVTSKGFISYGLNEGRPALMFVATAPHGHGP